MIMNKKNTKTLAKYLLAKGVESSLKIQKILFFLHVEEMRHKINYGYFKKFNNFQAWIYGPVNVESFFEMQKFFSKNEEKEQFTIDIDEIKEIDKLYGKWLSKYLNLSATELVEMSHRNHSWKRARKNLGTDESCKNYLIEDNEFITFDN